MGAREELWQMYQKETAVEVKRQILQSLFVSGEATRLIEVANTEQNPELRRRAVQHLGTMGRTKTGDALVGIYAKEKETDIKRYVINALVRAEQRRLAGRHRPQGNRSGAEARDGVEAVADDASRRSPWTT